MELHGLLVEIFRNATHLVRESLQRIGARRAASRNEGSVWQEPGGVGWLALLP